MKQTSCVSLVSATENTISADGSNETISSVRRKIFFIWEPLVIGFLIFPISVIFWQSGWNFMYEFLQTPLGRQQATLPLLYLLSQFIFFIIYLNQDHIYNFLVKQKFKFVAAIVLQIHSLIVALSYIIQWISMWTLWDNYTSNDWLLMLVISIAAILATIALTGSSYDLVCAPFIMSYDSIEYNVAIATPFITENVIYH